MKFEYKQLRFEAGKIENGDANVETHLNELGQEGWELVGFSTFSYTDGDDDSGYSLGFDSIALYVLKRAL